MGFWGNEYRKWLDCDVNGNTFSDKDKNANIRYYKYFSLDEAKKAIVGFKTPNNSTKYHYPTETELEEVNLG